MAEAQLDGAQLAILANRFEGISSKMGNTLLRTGRSGVLNRAKDFSCCILTADSELLAVAESLPIHVLSGPDIMARSMKEFHPDLKKGDAVVHADHGIGLYRGLMELEMGLGRPSAEMLCIEYAGGDRLFLPVHRLNRVQRYSGSEGAAPRLDRLGGQLHHAALDALQLVAGAGQQQQHEHVGHLRDPGLGLSDADGLDDDDVEAGRLAEDQRLATAPGNTTQGLPGRRRSYKGLAASGKLFHARLVAEDGPAADRGRRVHGEHGRAVAGINNMIAECLDEGRFTDAGNTGYSEPDRVAGMRHHALEQGVGTRTVVPPRRFDQRDRPGKRAPVAVDDGGRQ